MMALLRPKETTRENSINRRIAREGEMGRNSYKQDVTTVSSARIFKELGISVWAVWAWGCHLKSSRE